MIIYLRPGNIPGSSTRLRLVSKFNSTILVVFGIRIFINMPLNGVKLK